MTEDQKLRYIKALRMVFVASCAAFDLQDAMIGIAGRFPPTPSKMKSLHKIAREEIMNENPDMEKMDFLLSEMQELAEQNKLQTS